MSAGNQVDPRIVLRVVAKQHLSRADTLSRKSRIAPKARTQIRSGTSTAGAANNLIALTQADSRAVILLVGEGNYAARYQNFLKHYQDIVKRSPKAKVFDLRLDDRITVKE